MMPSKKTILANKVKHLEVFALNLMKVVQGSAAFLHNMDEAKKLNLEDPEDRKTYDTLKEIYEGIFKETK